MSHSAVLVAISPTTDIEKAVQHEMAPFDEQGEWFGDGSRWDWWVIGGRYCNRLLGKDVLPRSQVNLDQMRRDEINRYTKNFSESRNRGYPENAFEFITGIKLDETLEQYLARKVKTGFPWFGAFLKDRTWHEHKRLGWFGVDASTECARAGADTHVCLFENADAGSKIYSWNSNEAWDEIFFKRFVEPLPPETLLVNVDYHV